MLTRFFGILICYLLVFNQPSLGDDNHNLGASESSTTFEEEASVCILTEAELNSLLKVVQDAIKFTTVESLESLLSSPILNADQCDEVQEIKDSIDTLKQLVRSMADSSISDDRFKELTAASGDLVKDIKDSFDKVQRASFEATKVKVLDIQENIEKLGDNLDLFIARNQETRDRNREIRIQLCVYQIHNEEYVAAVNTFNEFNDDNMVDHIVERAYTRAKIYNVLQFVHHLGTLEQVTRGAEMAYQKMQANADMGSHFLLFLNYDIVETRKNQSSGSMNSRLGTLYKNLEVPVKNVLNSLGLMVRGGESTNFGNIVRAFKAPSGTLNQYITQIIEIAYATYDPTKVKNILNCINVLTSPNLIYLGHKALFNRMSSASHLKSRSEVFLLAYKIKKSYEALNNNNDPGNVIRNGYLGMKNGLPTSVVSILWNTYSRIKSQYFNEFLYSPDNNWNFDNTRRFVFTWVPGAEVNTAQWIFETDNEGQSFYIRNQARGEYLFVDSKFFDKNRRHVFTHRTAYRPVGARWVISPLASGLVTLRNEYVQEYFYAGQSKKNNDRRYVFTWITGELLTGADFYIY